MTDSMIERVARAIVLQIKETDRQDQSDDWRNWAKEARAAIEAMREPKPEMLAAVRGIAGAQVAAFAAASWPTMIDAALSEEAK